MAELPPISIKNIGTYGVIRQAELDDYLMPDGAVAEVSNFSFDRKGTASLRLGMAAIGSTVSAGNACVGLFNVQSQTLVAAFATNVYNRETATSTWNAGLTGLTSGQRTRFVDFANRTIMVNGSYDSIRVWNGSNSAGWVSTGTPINPNQFASDASVNTQTLRAKFIEVYKSRVYLAGDPTSPDRLFFSSVISSAGNITWTPSTDFVDINPSDGENIIALKRYSLELLVFKQNYIYRFRTSGVDPDPLIKIGTRSQESVVEGKKGVYFHHPTGFYRYSGGYPEELSRPISDFISNITYANYALIAGWRDDDHVYWSVGNVTIPETTGNVTYSNCVLRFTESSELWTIYNYANGIRRGVDYDTGSALSRVVGTDGSSSNGGVVATFNSGNNDLGEPISYRLVTKWYDWGSQSILKILQEIVAITEFAEGITLMYQVDGEYAWNELGQLKDYFTYFRHNVIECHRIRFKIAGVASTTGPIFRGLEVYQGLISGENIE